MSVAIRDAVLELFERHRATPGAPFEESHFTNYLLAEPRGKEALHNSFRGLRRYNAFIDAVQLHFSVCFSLKDFEANYSLGQFVERIEALQASRRSSLASFRNQKRHGFGWGTVVILDLVAVVLIAAVRNLSGALAGVLFVALLLANVAVLGFYFQSRAYNQRLLRKLQDREAGNA